MSMEVVDANCLNIRYSKVTAEKQAWAFMKRESPGFDLVFHLSPAITGRSIEQGWRAIKHGLGGMSSVYRSLFDVESPKIMFPYFQDVDDVASMHVKSLDTVSVPGNKRYLATGGLLDMNEMARKIREEFPKLRSRVPEKSGEKLPVDIYKLDLTETDAVFGKQHKSAWESVKATVEDIISTEARSDGV
jgi:NADPH-dependent methylglyoxal reductase